MKQLDATCRSHFAFVGKPHRLDNRGGQVAKALKDIGFEHYVQAEKTGWVLYLEGATDLAILLALALRLDHPAVELLEAPYVHCVANLPRKAREHFHGLREANPDLSGVAIYDRLEPPPQADPNLPQLTWRQCEMENYLCRREVLLDFAHSEGISVTASPVRRTCSTTHPPRKCTTA